MCAEILGGGGVVQAAANLVRTARHKRRISIGIEGTFEPVTGRDTLSITGHYRGEAWKADLELVRSLGLEEVRLPIPWHRIEARKGTYRWEHMDRVISAASEEYGISIIADTLHHTSYPRWLEGGFASPDFAENYVRFVKAFAERYRQVTTFTPFNEPTCTLDFCANRGFWHPFGKGDGSYVRALRNTAFATARAIEEILAVRPDGFILQVDTFQHHAAIDRASAERAAFLNERRFVFDELLLGRVTHDHPLAAYLLEHGFGKDDLEWHLEHAVPIHERGGNYYPLNEEQLENGCTKHAPSLEPRGLAEVAKDYHERLGIPLSMTETNIQGTVRDRISWLKYILEQLENLERDGIEMKRFAWYPLFDCAGWNSLLQGKRWKRDPQGIFTCGTGWRREATELSEIYSRLVEGLTSADIPAYTFTPRHARTLGPLMRQMKWEWQPQHGADSDTPTRRKGSRTVREEAGYSAG